MSTSQRKPWTRDQKIGLASLTVAVIGVVIVVLFPEVRIWLHLEKPAEIPTVITPANPPPVVAILADCETTSLPISIPAQTSLHLVSLNRKFMLTQNWGLYDVPNSTEKMQQWPSKEKLEAAKRLHDPGVFGYKCDFSNHSQANVLDVAVPMRLWFGLKGGEENAVKYTAILSPLDAGSHFIIYIMNDCPISVAGVLPDIVSITVVGDTTRHDVPLNRPHRNPIEPIMGFFPSKIQWVRQVPCE